MIEQKVSGKYIELYKLLKLANLVASGGEAKMVIEDLMVSVNGVIETRKRNKLKNGDIVSFAGEEIRVNAET
jgi:ribosome-associated protein|tara:strand:- start:565 stop:780 length:216 start_codon:yes stop_codon:yes gene_type:complete